MKKTLFILIITLFSVSLATPVVTHADLVTSDITINPYLQRQSTSAVTILADTASAETVTLYYHKTSASTWKSKTDKTASTVHRYRLTNLKKGEAYEYYLQLGAVRLTQTHGFSTAHDITKDQPLRIAVFGDSGNNSVEQYEVASEMASWSPDLFLHTGDIAYDAGTEEEFIDNYFNVYSSIISSIPLYASIGNHEYTTDQAGPYKEYFETPTNSGSEDYYSFNYDKQVHIISLNANIDYSAGSAQYTWLNQDLADYQDYQWILVFFHQPVLSSATHGSTADMQDTLVPLFEQYNVDLVLNGHDHDYERFSAINGVHYLVTGGGGAALYGVSTAVAESLLFQAVHHFVGLTITPDSLKLQAINSEGFVFDTVTLKP